MALCNVIASEGFGFDVVSAGELYTTLQALSQSGLSYADNSERIYLHGNNKSISELNLARENNCTIVVDNWFELETLATMAKETDQKICILLRFTPGIECHTHEYIKTGHIDSKFGFDPNDLDPVLKFVSSNSGIECKGIHAHIGSQIFECKPHQDLAGVLVDWMKKAADYGLPIRELNVGGGLGIRYTESDDPPSIDEWAKGISMAVVAAIEATGLPQPKLIAEPGRSLVGTSCVTAYTIGSRKVVPGIRTYIAVDGGMSDNPRPITYQSQYLAIIANKMGAELKETVTVAGKHCESGDILIKDIQLPETKPGDILVVMATGAYNYSMASNYNRLPNPAAVLVNDGEANLIIKRESLEDLISQDLLPERLIK